MRRLWLEEVAETAESPAPAPIAKQESAEEEERQPQTQKEPQSPQHRQSPGPEGPVEPTGQAEPLQRSELQGLAPLPALGVPVGLVASRV